jgi:hypothetical protein
MAITSDSINRLKSQLLTSGISKQNQPLFQIINQLIDAVRDSVSTSNEALTHAGTGTGSGGTSFITVQQTLALINEGADDYSDVPPIPGPIGPTGSTGSVGPMGPMGAIIFPPDPEDGDIFPPIVGPKGNPGTTGLSGTNGTNGTIGQDGNDGEDGYFALATIPSSLVIAQAAQPASVNISTEGTVDWLVPAAITTLPRAQLSSALHTKALGGKLHLGFDWIVSGGTIFAQNDVMTITTTAGDDSANAVLAASIGSQGISIVAGINIGWRIVVPPSPNRISTLRIYCSTFSGECTINASMPFDGQSTSLTFDSGAAASLYRMLTIQYRSNGFLFVTARLTINRASTPNIKFQAASLA